MKRKKFIISIILCISIVFNGLFFAAVPQANAIPIAIANLPPQIGQFVSQLVDTIGTVGSWVIKIWEKAKAIYDAIQKAIGANLIVVAKVAALYAVQEAVALIVGDTDGQTNIIRDFEQYLYTNTKQLALDQMDDFFISTSGGRLSSFNYEGVGPNYDSYLINSAKEAIREASGTSGAIVTNIQDQVADPSKDMFAGKNMKGIMSYMSCANNPACYQIAVYAKYESEIEKARDVAKTEQNNGILPIKDALGRITKPGEMVKDMLTDLDKFGSNLILDAPIKGEDSASVLLQIAEGAVLAIAARAINFGIEDQEGKIIAASSSSGSSSSSYAFSLTYASIAPAMASPH